MRRKLPLINVFFVLLAACLIVGCSSIPNSGNSSDVSEITLSNGGGQMVYWYKFVFKRDGTARYEGDVAPEYRGEAKSFGTSVKEGERVKYRGTITPEQFDALARLVYDKDFFSMKVDNGGVLGAPQTTTGVVSSGKRKEVFNQTGQGGEKLAEIENAIGTAANQIKWEKDVK
jgi:hypothetical protein